MTTLTWLHDVTKPTFLISYQVNLLERWFFIVSIILEVAEFKTVTGIDIVFTWWRHNIRHGPTFMTWHNLLYLSYSSWIYALQMIFLVSSIFGVAEFRNDIYFVFDWWRHVMTWHHDVTWRLVMTPQNMLHLSELVDMLILFCCYGFFESWVPNFYKFCICMKTIRARCHVMTSQNVLPLSQLSFVPRDDSFFLFLLLFPLSSTQIS